MHDKPPSLVLQSQAAVRAFLRMSRQSPDSAYSLIRGFGRQIMDAAFETQSPLPFMSPEQIAAIFDAEITLPPTSWLKSGNQNIDGLIFLASLAKFLNASTVFEIGTYNGVTAWTLARNTTALVSTLDLAAEQQTILPLGIGDRGNRIDFATRAYPLPDDCGRVEQHWGDSATFDFSPWHDRCDLVYIDGSHSAPYVASDTRNAFSMVRPGGAIVWDDYWRRVPGVPSILNQLAGWWGSDRINRVPGTRLAVLSDVGPADEPSWSAFQTMVRSGKT